MRPNSSDISFNLFGFPTFIQPFFWVVAALITALHLGGINDMPLWIAQVFVGMAAILLSILIHELGHALTFRYLFRTPCIIVLHGFGGMAVPQQQYRRSVGFSGAAAESFLAFSGPLAGFLLAFAAIMLYRIVPANHDGLAFFLLNYFLVWTMWISIVWGIFNLLPIYPMDGGHIARAACVFFFPLRGVEVSLVLSMMCAALLIALALQMGLIFVAFFLAYFAYQNYQEWSARSFGR